MIVNRKGVFAHVSLGHGYERRNYHVQISKPSPLRHWRSRAGFASRDSPFGFFQGRLRRLPHMVFSQLLPTFLSSVFASQFADQVGFGLAVRLAVGMQDLVEPDWRLMLHIRMVP